MGTAIFTDSRGSGALMWVSDAADPMAALRELDADVGIDPHGEGLETVADRFVFYAIPAEEMDDWRAAEAFRFPDTSGLERIA